MNKGLPHNQPVHRVVDHLFTVWPRLVCHVDQALLQIVQVVLQIRGEGENLIPKALISPSVEVGLVQVIVGGDLFLNVLDGFHA